MDPDRNGHTAGGIGVTAGIENKRYSPRLAPNIFGIYAGQTWSLIRATIFPACQGRQNGQLRSAVGAWLVHQF
jgi:hypothetical protein